jgi:uncharacterized membrane protein YjjB (DUF3815 family)
MALIMNFISLWHQAACGAIAAAGFGVLFNVGFRMLPWCAVSGAIALTMRACCLGLGMNLEGASFAAALTVGAAVQLLWRRTDISQDVLDVVGCIPMVPGSFAAKAILGLFALTTSAVANESDTLITATQYTLRVLFTMGAIGTGLAIPALLLRVRTSR